jgi:hypothetical protein
MRVETPAEQILYSTVRLEIEGSEPHQIGAGTAFIFALKTERGSLPCLVTNKHMVKGAQVGRFFFTTGTGNKPNVGEPLDILMENFEAQWCGHPDPEIDVAAMSLGPLLHKASAMGKEVFYRSIGQSLIPTAEQLEELDALEEVVFVGYPSGIYDSVNLLPVFRRGVTATPIQMDYSGKPVFLVDASVFPGSSGSPVLIYNLGGYGSRKGLHAGTRLLFLGVIAQATYREEEGTLEFKSIPTALVPVVRTKQMINLGVVFKATTVVETVHELLSVLASEGSI